jgi:hypothetical protein
MTEFTESHHPSIITFDGFVFVNLLPIKEYLDIQKNQCCDLISGHTNLQQCNKHQGAGT